MGRPPLAPGAHGRIGFYQDHITDRVRARARLRDYDGHGRALTLWGATEANARARLLVALDEHAAVPPGSGRLVHSCARSCHCGQPRVVIRAYLPVSSANPDLDCGDIPSLFKPIPITSSDIHRLDADGDGFGCDVSVLRR